MLPISTQAKALIDSKVPLERIVSVEDDEIKGKIATNIVVDKLGEHVQSGLNKYQKVRGLGFKNIDMEGIVEKVEEGLRKYAQKGHVSMALESCERALELGINIEREKCIDNKEIEKSIKEDMIYGRVYSALETLHLALKLGYNVSKECITVEEIKKSIKKDMRDGRVNSALETLHLALNLRYNVSKECIDNKEIEIYIKENKELKHALETYVLALKLGYEISEKCITSKEVEEAIMTIIKIGFGSLEDICKPAIDSGIINTGDIAKKIEKWIKRKMDEGFIYNALKGYCMAHESGVEVSEKCIDVEKVEKWATEEIKKGNVGAVVDLCKRCNLERKIFHPSIWPHLKNAYS